MITNIRKKTTGVTIIEVLIVLAIAGLIMLVVFLAVPALQRNSENTKRRTEAARILTATQEFMTNKNGTLPAAADNTEIKNLANATNSVTVEAEAGTTAPTASLVIVRTKAKCNATTDETDAGSDRQVAVLYKIEGGGGTLTTVCAAA